MPQAVSAPQSARRSQEIAFSKLAPVRYGWVRAGASCLPPQGRPARLGPCRGAGCVWLEDTKRALTEKPNGSVEYQGRNCRECDKPTCMVSRFRLSVCSWEGRRGRVTGGAFLLGWSGAVGAAPLRSSGEFARKCRLLAGLY